MNTNQVDEKCVEISETDRLKSSCRLCLAPEQDVNIYSKYRTYRNSITYVEVLQQLTDEQVSFNDCLPTKICMECASKLVLFYKFRKKIETSKITLSSILLQNESDSMKLEDVVQEMSEEIEINEQNLEPIEQVDDGDNDDDDDELKEEGNSVSDKRKDNQYFEDFMNIDDTIEECYTETESIKYSPEEYETNNDTAIDTIVVLKKRVKKITEHQCDECGRIFTRKSVLEQHKNTHSGIKNFNCEICKSWFTRRSHLLIHMRIHENSKPFICEICSRGFRKSGDLARHRRIHFPDRNYPCTMCDKRFKRATDVTSHMRVHTKAKPYRCREPKCEKTYTSHSSLRKHETRKHEDLLHSTSLMGNDKSPKMYEIYQMD